MPRLSIIIPAVRSIESLEATLVSVLQNRPVDSEVIVVLNQPYADPYDLRDEVRFLQAPARAGFIACANLGLHGCLAPVVHLLDSGCEVSEGWADEALRDLHDPRVAAVAPLVLDHHQRDVVLAAGLGYHAGGARYLRRAKLSKLPGEPRAVFGACSFAGFFRTSALQAVGGFDLALGDEFADADLAWMLQSAGFTALFEPRSRVYAGAEVRGMRPGFRRGLQAERLFWRNAPSAGWLKSLLSHPWVVAAEAIRCLPSLAVMTQLCGRFVAYCSLGRYREHYRRLNQLQAGAEAPQPAWGMPENMRLDRAHAALKPAESHSVRARAG